MTRAELEVEFVGAALRWVAYELQMTDSEIGQTVGVNEGTVRRWRTRESAPTREQRARD